MIRYPSFIIVFLIVFVAISLYQVKHFITQKELELAAINKKIINTQSDLNILKAELSYLKRPNRIEKIARNKLDLNDFIFIGGATLVQFTIFAYTKIDGIQHGLRFHNSIEKIKHIEIFKFQSKSSFFQHIWRIF